MANKPNFFIVGAPKCGTTALHNYLTQHPEVFMPEEKELNFFDTDHNFPLFERSWNKYHSCFTGAGQAKMIGEASVYYLCSKVAAGRIKEFSPNAKIIIMLRNPVDMLYSMHSQLIYSCAENIKDFAEAVRNDTPKAQPFAGFTYKETVQFTQQIQNYRAVFGLGNINIIFYEDFKNETSKTYKAVLDFLELEPSFIPEIKVLNPNKGVRNKTISNFIWNPPLAMLHMARAVIPMKWRGKLLRQILHWNSFQVARPPMDPEVRTRLQKEFSPEVEALGGLLKRDLTCWLT